MIIKIIDFNFDANYNFYFLLPEDGANYKFCKYFGSILVQIDYSMIR